MIKCGTHKINDAENCNIFFRIFFFFCIKNLRLKVKYDKRHTEQTGSYIYKTIFEFRVYSGRSRQYCSFAFHQF